MTSVKIPPSSGMFPSWVMRRVGGVVVAVASKAGFWTRVMEAISGTRMPSTRLPAIPGFWASRR